MKPFQGIEVYEILENGNLLNGIYANTDSIDDKTKSKYDIDNEIARKNPYDDQGIDVVGDYECRYIERRPEVVTHCTLKVTKCGEVYEFVWTDGELIFTGIGLKVGNNHIAVSYW